MKFRLNTNLEGNMNDHLKPREDHPDHVPFAADLVAAGVVLAAKIAVRLALGPNPGNLPYVLMSDQRIHRTDLECRRSHEAYNPRYMDQRETAIVLANKDGAACPCLIGITDVAALIHTR